MGGSGIFRKFIEKFIRCLALGENFRASSLGRPGQAQDYRKLGSAGLPKGDPEIAQNGAQNEPKMGPKMSPKRSPFRGPKSSKTLCFRGVSAQNGPPKGAPKRAQNWSQNEPNSGPKRGQKGGKRGSKSIEIVALRNKPKWGVRKSLENLLENLLV